jgi:hypothetical protein
MSTIRLGLIFLAMSCAEPTAISSRPVAPAIVARPQDNTYSINAADRSIYVRITRVRSEGGEPIHAFMRRMFESADSANALRLVIDLRSITGVDARLLVPLIRGVATRDRFVQGEGLYVIVGPDSFGPAQSAATLLQHYANPIFVR